MPPVTISPYPTQEIPEQNIDYFKIYDVFTLYKCWRNATKHKDHIINGRRLENASWRKYFQLRFGLRTVNPSVLNWEKDSDVVWLYGPMVGLQEFKPLFQIQAEAEAFDPEAEFKHPPLKPAIKKRVEPQDYTQQLIEFKKHIVRTRSSEQLVADAFANTNPLLTPPTGQKADFLLSNGPLKKPDRPTHRRVNTLDNEIFTTPQALTTTTVVRPKSYYSLNQAVTEPTAKQLRFNESVEQARIVDQDSDHSGSLRRVPLPKSPIGKNRTGFLVDDDEEEEEEDFDEAGATYANQMFDDVASADDRRSEIDQQFISNTSAYQNYIAQSPPISLHIATSPTPTLLSAQSHNLDELEAVIGAVAGSGTNSPGGGLLRRTQSEGNNFYVLARKLASASSTPSPSMTNPSASRSPSIRSQVTRTPSNGSVKAPTTPLSLQRPINNKSNTTNIPRVNSGLIHIPPTTLKSDEEDSDSEEEDFIQSKLAAAVLSKQKGSPPAGIFKETFDDEDSDTSSDEDEDDDGLSFGGLKKPLQLEEDGDVESDAIQVPAISATPPSATSVNITSSLVRTTSWIASTYPANALSLGQLLYGPDIDVNTQGSQKPENDLETESDSVNVAVGVTRSIINEEPTEEENQQTNQETNKVLTPPTASTSLPSETPTKVEVEDKTDKNEKKVLFGERILLGMNNVVQWASGRRWSLL